MRTATDLSAATASRLSIANTHEALSDVEAWVRSIAARHDLSERDLFHLDLVLTESRNICHRINSDGGLCAR